MSTRPVPAPRTRGWRIGSIAGAPVILTGGSAILAIAVYALFLPTIQASLGQGVTTYLWTAGLPLGLMASILAHELSHGLTARRFGIPVSEYVLTLWGGHTSFAPHIDRPLRGALVAVAGPAANGAIALAVWVMLQVLPPSEASLILWFVMVSNVLLAAFNLLPGLPTDGGHLLLSGIWALTGDKLRATQIAGWAGYALAGALGGWGLWTAAVQGEPFRGLWAILIAMVLYLGARDSLRRTRAQRAVAALDLQAMIEPVQVLSEDTTVAELVDRVRHDPRPVIVTDENGRPRAAVNNEALAGVNREAWAHTTLAAVSTPIPPASVITTIHSSDALGQIAAAAQAGHRTLVVIGGEAPAHVLGTLSVARVIAALP